MPTLDRSCPILLSLILGLAALSCVPEAGRGTPRASDLRPPGGGDGLWQDAAIFDAVHSVMATARSRVWVEMYEFDRADLAGSMAAARSAGADVRLVYDPSVAVSRNTAARLRAGGVDARPYPLDDRRHQIDHVKLLLTETSAVVGGMNWGTHSAANHDYAFESHDAALLDALGQIFTHDWGLAAALPAIDSGQLRHSEGVVGVVQTAPGSGIRQALAEATAAARHRIEAEVFALTDPDVIAALAQAARRGVEVKVLLDPNQDVNTPTSGLLRQGGVSVRWYPVAPGSKLHAKAGLFDGRLVVGSANWSRSGLGVNHELDLVIDGGAAAGAYASRFSADWRAAG